MLGTITHPETLEPIDANSWFEHYGQEKCGETPGGHARFSNPKIITLNGSEQTLQLQTKSTVCPNAKVKEYKSCDAVLLGDGPLGNLPVDIFSSGLKLDVQALGEGKFSVTVSGSCANDLIITISDQPLLPQHQASSTDNCDGLWCQHYGCDGMGSYWCSADLKYKTLAQTAPLGTSQVYYFDSAMEQIASTKNNVCFTIRYRNKGWAGQVLNEPNCITRSEIGGKIDTVQTPTTFTPAQRLKGTKCVKAGVFRRAEMVRYQCTKTAKGLKWTIAAKN